MALHLVTRNDGPLGKRDGLPFHALERQGIPAEDVLLQHVAHRFKKQRVNGAFNGSLRLPFDNPEQTLAAIVRIILEDIHSIILATATKA